MAGINGVHAGGGGGGAAAAGAMDVEPSAVDRTRGVKRQASESNLNDHDRFDLGKRLRALSIRNDEKRAEKNSTPTFHKRFPSRNGVLATGFRRDPAPYPPPSGEGMDVDDTRNRVYIADLDAELSSSDTDEEKLIFLPDIEKRLSRLPRQVFQPTTARVSNENGPEGPQDLVLYSDPKSLSVADSSQDSVRRAVVEARQRAREVAREKERERQVDMERMYSSAVAEGGMVGGVETAHGYGDVGYEGMEGLGGEDPDAMDLG